MNTKIIMTELTNLIYNREEKGEMTSLHLILFMIVLVTITKFIVNLFWGFVPYKLEESEITRKHRIAKTDFHNFFTVPSDEWFIEFYEE